MKYSKTDKLILSDILKENANYQRKNSLEKLDLKF